MIRHAQPGDEDAIAQIHVASWQSAYAGLVPVAYLDALDWRERAEQWRERLRQPPAGTVVCAAPATAGLIGFAFFGPSRDVADRDEHELYAVYVLPPGLALRCRQRTLERGIERSRRSG